MRKQAEENKAAWEYRAYEFWAGNYGNPGEKAAELKENPLAKLDVHQKYFEDISGRTLANICGSNGRIAVPLALLGADVTIFDISEENRRYALELAEACGVSVEYVLGDFMELDTARHANAFDTAYAEGGILHYFGDIEAFANIVYAIVKPGGRLILSDFHPFRKVNPTGSRMFSVPETGGDYFDSRMHEGPVAYEHLFPEVEQADFPKCQLRYYTISEIINAVIGAGFTLREFLEHPNYENRKLPGLFTIYAVK